MRLVRPLGLLAATLVVAAAWSGPALAASPVNLEAPTVSLTRPDVGEVALGDVGTWSGAAGYTYQWQRCLGATCTDISGATSVDYTVTTADEGYTLQLTVTADDGSGAQKTMTTAPTLAIPQFTVGSAHTFVHYVADATTYPYAITQTKAGDLAALAERAYVAELAAGYPAPLTDNAHGGDGRIDIYVETISTPNVIGLAYPESNGSGESGFIVLDGANPSGSLQQHTVAHELFHLIQFGFGGSTDGWLTEGSAEWMGYRVDGYASNSGGGYELGSWDMSLDCKSPGGTDNCALNDGYGNGGYSRWPFFEFLTERWGSDFVKNVFQKVAAGTTSGIDAVTQAVTAKGSTLNDTFTDFTVANMLGSYSVDALKTAPITTAATIQTGTLAALNAATKAGAARVLTGPIPTAVVSVDHLAARYVEIDHGNGSLKDGPCYAATLKLSVSLPAGIGARPYFWWSQPNDDGSPRPPTPLSVDGNTASATIPWDTCQWAAPAYLDLPNPSTGTDSADFTVTGSLTVDTSTQSTAKPPPPQVRMHGPTVVAPGSDGVPDIELYGPDLIHVASGSTQLRVVVSADDSGKVRATLGSLELGTLPVRPGTNALVFPLSAKALQSRRKVADAAAMLYLTPLSTSGAAGTPIARRVVFDQAPKTTAGAKKAKTEAKKAPARKKAPAKIRRVAAARR